MMDVVRCCDGDFKIVKEKVGARCVCFFEED